MTSNFLGSLQKELKIGEFTVRLFELSDELYASNSFNHGFVPNLTISSKDNSDIPVRFSAPIKIEFLKKGTGFDYFTDIEIENKSLFVTTYGCIRLRLNMDTGELEFSEELR